MNYNLPHSLTVNGTEYAIESDFRRVLDIMEMFSDPELSDNEKALLMLDGLYKDFGDIPYSDYQEAARQAAWFIDGDISESGETKGPKLVDWAKDFRYIVAPVNRIMGCDVRGMDYCHWWTFLAAWQEMGDCMFAQIVNIRSKKAKGKKLSKEEQEFYRRNRKAVDFERVYSDEENALLAEWT